MGAIMEANQQSRLHHRAHAHTTGQLIYREGLL